MKAIAIIGTFLLLAPLAGAQEKPAVSPRETKDLERIRDTLSYRVEEAQKLADDGSLEKADAVYADLLDVFEAADPLAAQTWLKAAALKLELKDSDRAIELYQEVLDRFSHIPWATDEARRQLEKLGVKPEAGMPGIMAEKPAKAYRLEIRDRIVSLSLRDAKLSSLQDLFKKQFNVSLEVDPDLASETVSINLKNVAIPDVLATIAKKLDAKLEPKAKGYRLVANTQPIKRTTQASKNRIIRIGELSRDEIAKVVRANLRGIQSCYEKNLLKNPALSGKIVLKWVIDENGSVSKAEIVSDGLHNSKVGACLLTEARKWKFPHPRGGGVVTVTYPFMFNSVGF